MTLTDGNLQPPVIVTSCRWLSDGISNIMEVLLILSKTIGGKLRDQKVTEVTDDPLKMITECIDY